MKLKCFMNNKFDYDKFVGHIIIIIFENDALGNRI